ncbi:hypothetical protein ACFX2I_020734 [Malus domestica]|uniref:uncharacterized protein LOC126607793 n=1 Tax=Malus sylvestris TaxID=3752 RepID=UPI0021ABFC0B|nr:uncharacterized protein LOC126607793 [Malus sylvestris]
MRKATSKIAMIAVFLVIAFCVPLFSEAVIVVRHCSTDADCTSFQCSVDVSATCVNNYCNCQQASNINTRDSGLPNQYGLQSQCFNQTDCAKIGIICPTIGKLDCVDGQCKCIDEKAVARQRVDSGRLQPNRIGQCFSETDCNGITCSPGTPTCLDGHCLCVDSA